MGEDRQGGLAWQAGRVPVKPPLCSCLLSLGPRGVSCQCQTLLHPTLC